MKKLTPASAALLSFAAAGVEAQEAAYNLSIRDYRFSPAQIEMPANLDAGGRPVCTWSVDTGDPA